jgi:pimeloyl-ACP methyl ester carboxylesterase
MNKLNLKQEYEFSEGLVRYDIIGDGPSVVLVHGTPWSSFTWYKLAPVLAQRYRVYYYDLIGYGQSAKRDGQNVSLGAQNRLLTELLDHWNLDNPRVVAHDIGGATTLRTHLLDNRDFEKMVLINVVAIAPWGSPFCAHVQQHESGFSGVPAYIHKAIVEAYIQGALSNPLETEEFDTLVRPWLDDAGQAAFYRQIVQASQQYTDEVEPRYANIRCPVQILWGEEDVWIPFATGERLHQAIPHSQFCPVAKAGHLSQLDAPVTIASCVMRFLR